MQRSSERVTTFRGTYITDPWSGDVLVREEAVGHGTAVSFDEIVPAQDRGRHGTFEFTVRFTREK